MSRRGRFLEGFTFAGLVVVLALLAAASGGWMFLRPGDDGAKDKTTVADSAEGMALAQRISSEMRAMKQAAAMYKSDQGRWPEWTFDEAAGSYRNMSPGGEGILPDSYVDRLPGGDGYFIEITAVTDSYGKEGAYVVLYDRGLSKAVKEHLASRARQSGFLGASGS
ncbi:MAG: hypothetical protein ACP5DY_04115, partial [Thermovirgaceae bacterium]